LEKGINTAVYSELGERWYTADDDPIALLRAESRFRNPFVLEQIRSLGGSADVLDLGCGAGFLSNYLAENGCNVTAVDLSEEALQVARKRDLTESVKYQKADVSRLNLRYSFDVVTAMDILEHMDDPENLVEVACRHLKPGGKFIFYTFNRNPLSYILAIKAVEVFVANVPKNLHLYEMFITPKEIKNMLMAFGFDEIDLRGVKPKLPLAHLKQIALTGRVPKDFEFEFSSNRLVAYLGLATRLND
jgi:2-polyprenyl-6-hydroxyphenyl methylase/3-demethylubiquinone-9 3-methyltransferase